MHFFSDQLNLRIVANCFVSWILITASPVVRLAKFVVRGVIKAGHLCLTEFYGSDLQIHSTQQWGKYVLPLEKALPWREAPRETCRVRLWNKSLPCSNVIVVHVMSAWKAHCLLWQSQWTVPVCYSGQKYVENILDVSLKLGHFGLRVDEFQNVTFVASFKLTLEIKCYTEPRFYCEVGKVKGRRERPGEPCLWANYLSSCRGDERHGSVCSVHHAHKSSLSTRFKCARMHGNTNTSSTYNRRSIIASWL